MSIKPLHLALLLSFLICSTKLAAAPITFEYVATITTVSSGLTGTLSAGDTITGSYTFESTTPGTFIPAPDPLFLRDNLVFIDPLTSVSLSVNGESASGPGISKIEMNDSANGMFAGDDDYLVSASLVTGPIGGLTPLDLQLSVFYPFDSYDLTATSALPTSLPPLANATFASFSMNLENGNFIIASLDRLESTAVIPVPAAMWLIASGLAALLGMQLRSRR